MMTWLKMPVCGMQINIDAMMLKRVLQKLLLLRVCGGFNLAYLSIDHLSQWYAKMYFLLLFHC